MLPLDATWMPVLQAKQELILHSKMQPRRFRPPAGLPVIQTL